MGWNEFGSALDDYINSKRGMKAVGTLERERGASDQYQDAQKRTDQWLASLSPEDLKKVRPDTTRVASDFEGIGDVKNFDLDKRQRQLGLTSEFSTTPEVQNYMKANETEKKNKIDSSVASALAEATKGMQRNKQFADLNKLEEQVGVPKADYNLQSNRDIATGANLPNYAGNASVDQWYKTNVNDPENMDYKQTALDKKGTGGAGSNVWSQKDYKYRNDPEALPALKSQLSDFKDKNIIDNDLYEMLDRLSNTDPANAEMIFNKAVSAPKIAGASAWATVDPKAASAAANTTASGNAEAFTPKFVAERKKEWDKTLADYNEGYQQFALGKAAPDDGTGDVALINALEKVRELNSAVMYGDYEKWNKATNFWQSLEQNGLIDASTAKLKNRLPPETRADIKNLLSEMYGNRKAVLTSARGAAVQAAKEDYGWGDEKANRIYRMPELGFTAGYDEKGDGKKPVVTEPKPATPPTTKPNPLDNVGNFAKTEGAEIEKRNATKYLEEVRKRRAALQNGGQK